MNIGLSMLYCLGEPFPAMISHLTDFDVSYVELVDESQHALNQRRVNILKRVARENGLEFTVHAPFVDINIASPNPVLRRVMLRRLEKSLSYARQLKSRQWVFHSGWKSSVSEFYPNLDWQINLRSVRSLLTTAKKLEVEISLENTPEPFHFLVKRMQDFALFCSELGSDFDIDITLDVAHANTSQQVFEFIERFANKITHVHISDNEGKYDSHRGIGYGKIEWVQVAKAIRKINYKGIVMLESIDHVEESLQTMRQLFI